MGILRSDSFDHYTTITNKWDLGAYGSATINAAYGRLDTAGIRFPKGDNGVGFTLPANKTTLIIGQAIYFQDVSNDHVLAMFMDDSNCQVKVIQEGTDIVAYRDTTSLGSAAHGMVAGYWYYVEIKVTIDSSSGEVTVKIDGTQKLNLTSQNTQATGNSYCTIFVLGGNTDAGASSYTYRDDVLLMDTSGSFCNDFKGDVVIQALSPNATGSNTDWTASSGDNYACVDEKPPNTADYIETATVNAIDSYPAGDVSPLTGEIYAVVINHFSQKTGSAARGVSGYALDTGVGTVGNENILDADYKMRQSVMYQNARTSAAWTIADVNGAEFGVKLTT